MLKALKQAYELISSKLWPFLKPVVSNVSLQTLGIISEIAYDAVVKVATDPAFAHDNAAKREWVAEELRKHPFVTVNKFTDSVIYLVIELAVQRLKASK